MKTSLRLFGLLLITTSAWAQVLFDENFDAYADGVTSVTGLVFDPTQYAVATDTTFGTDKVLQTTSTQQNVGGVFTATPLATGEYITLHVHYRWTSAPTPDIPGNFIRLGLYNSGGTAMTAHTDTVFGDDAGYLADSTYYSSQFGYALRQEDSANTAFTEILLDEFGTPDMTQFGGDAAKGADNTGDFSIISLRVFNTVSGVQLDLAMDDPFFGGASVISDFDASSPITTFDSLFVRAAGDLGVSSFQIEKIRVVTGAAVPEPAHATGLLGLLGLGFALVRRRRFRGPR